MSFIQYFLITYCALSILSLLNKGVRHLYIASFDNLYKYFIVDLYGRFPNVKLKHFKQLPLKCLAEIIYLVFVFIFAPIAIVWNLPTGGFKFRYGITPYWKCKTPPPIKQEYFFSPIIIRIKENIPFIPYEKQIIYFEASYNEAINSYILKNLDKLKEDFQSINYIFVYFSKYIENKLNQDMTEALLYTFPFVNTDNLFQDNTIIPKQIEETILNYVDNPDDLGAGLLKYKQTENGYHIFTYYQFRVFEAKEIGEQFRAYLKGLTKFGEGDVLYSSGHPTYDDGTADSNFPVAAKDLIKEIKEKITALKQLGVDKMILKTIFSFETEAKLSRLVITSEYKIILPDYNNMEITMYPLPKAVFFLFLNHPEGILFKNLLDYRDELVAIYKKISGRENIENMEKSINDIVNPMLNSINEKCSRIREAFISKFDESIAQNYFITGERATPKTIILNRDLVLWEANI